MHVTNKPVFDEDGRLVAVIAVSLDTTERRKAEQARQQLSAIVDGSGDAIFSATTEGTITSWNGAAEQLFGFTADEIIGQPVAWIAPADKVGEQRQMRERLTTGGPHERLETTRRHKNGSLVEVLLTASTATDDAGAVVGLSVIAHDITGRRRAREELEVSQLQLAEAQRIAHLGSFQVDVATGKLT